MKKFLRENKIVIAILAGALIVAVGIYFGLEGGPKEESTVPTECLASPKTMVTKVLDGDTVIVKGGYHVRLLGIDTDESEGACYRQAKTRLEELVLNKKVKLEKDQTDVDQYGRCLRYIFLPAEAPSFAEVDSATKTESEKVSLDNQNINLQLVKEGLAVARFYPPNVRYKKEITQAEEKAIENNIGCKWSSAAETSRDEGEKVEFEWEKLTTSKLGYDVVDACQAGQYLGRELIVQGKIVDAYHHLESNTVFLNFGKPYPNSCFVGVIFGSNLYKFVQQPEQYYLNKTVRITGEVKQYQGKQEIILEAPSQIEVGEVVRD